MRNRKSKNSINIRARINRHLRISREVGVKNKGKINYSISFVLLFMTLLFPVYPGLTTAFYENTPTEFYRGDIDESSILESYYSDAVPDVDTSLLKDNIDAFVSVNTILTGDRNTTGINEVVNYKVREGESYESIANDFGISINTILWANNFEKRHVIHPGDIIRVPPVTGLLYKINKGDTLESIAEKYNIELGSIEKQNNISRLDIIKVGEEIMLPGAKKIIPKPDPKPKYQPETPKSSNNIKKQNTPTVKTTTNTKTVQNTAVDQNVSSSGRYQLTWRAPKHTFYGGNCTWHVARYKNVTWGGNANQWLANARAQGKPTGSVPKPGAIIQFGGRGYNPRYGHVGIVLEVNGSNILVSDMNYRKKWEVTNRNVSINDPAIQGYIYVD